jgi:alkylation response protein AidB-like acyl-CoA dehydrogenase
MLDLRRHGFDPQHQQIYDMAWRYARERHHPLLRRMDDEDWFPADEYRRMGDIGLLGTTVPEALGGPRTRPRFAVFHRRGASPTGTTCSPRAGAPARTSA